MSNSVPALPINKTALKATEPPFGADILKRKPIADKLSSYINRLSKGHTIAINADWGEGKTWFGLNWEAQLKKDGHQTLWLDAFLCDHNEDPFIPIVSKLLSLKAEDEGKSLLETTKKVGKKLLPALGKAVVAGAVTAVVGKEGHEAIGAALDNADELAEEYLKRRIEQSKDDQNSIDALKAKLSEYAGKSGKPLVFFVDELDRCRPTFAIKLIERIKHFFETDNVVFVLLVNRRELECAIKNIYGLDAAHDYLNKFVHVFLTLPHFDYANAQHVPYLPEFAASCAEAMGLKVKDDLVTFCSSIEIPAKVFHLSLRDVERMLINYELSGYYQLPWFSAWLIGMKIKRYALFRRCWQGDKNGHKEVCDLLGGLPNEKKVSDLISCHKKRAGLTLDNQEQEFLGMVSNHVYRTAGNDFMTFIAQSIDLPSLR